MVRTVVVLLLSLIGVGLAGLDRLAAEETALPVLRYQGDGCRYLVGEYYGRFDLSKAPRYDTTRIDLAGPLVLISDIDTLVITQTLKPVDCLLVNGADTIFETIVYRPGGEKLNTLSRHGEFADTEVPSEWKIEYASPDDDSLRYLRETYRLDSIAGDGSEQERVLNLLEWAHTVVRHDGNSYNPSSRTAVGIIKACEEENRGVNCRMMATILNEALLATGFRSRHLTCLPASKEDPDCHVVNMVYLDAEQRWILIDPTFGAYFRDDDGRILGPLDVRQQMIDKAHLELPETMDWNGNPKPDWTYLTYMTKNLFRFSCPLRSEYGYESLAESPVWIYLLPAGYDAQLVGTVDTVESKSGKVTYKYYTDNADFFFAAP